MATVYAMDWLAMQTPRHRVLDVAAFWCGLGNQTQKD